MECIECGRSIESKGKKPKRFCSDACRMRNKRTETNKKRTPRTEQTNKRTEETNKRTTNEQIEIAPGLLLPPVPAIPAGGEPGPTGSTCHNFETLPAGVRAEIDSLTTWCKLKGIEDDRDARIARAIHYQRDVRRTA